MPLLLMDETAEQDVQAFCLVFRSPWAISCHPEEFILLVLHTFIWKERDPFPNRACKCVL